MFKCRQEEVTVVFSHWPSQLLFWSFTGQVSVQPTANEKSPHWLLGERALYNVPNQKITSASNKDQNQWDHSSLLHAFAECHWWKQHLWFNAATADSGIMGSTVLRQKMKIGFLRQSGSAPLAVSQPVDSVLIHVMLALIRVISSCCSFVHSIVPNIIESVVIESVDSICRDSADTQYMLIQTNFSKSPKQLTYKLL